MDKRKLFIASCVALLTTSMVFSVRGDILDAMSQDFHLTKEQMGLILSPAFWGFTLSILIAGSLVDFLGMRNLLTISSLGYIGGVLLILLAPLPSGPVTSIFSETGTTLLYAGMLILGLCQGLVEAVVNPLIATIYSKEKTHKLNALHAWWPGGLIIGGLTAYSLTKLMGLDVPGIQAQAVSLGWRIKFATVMVPAAVFGIMLLGKKFPPTERVAAGVSNGAMVKEAFRPLFLLFFACMWLTASTELGPDQWVSSLIFKLAQMQGVLILVYTAGIMFVLRSFAGPLLQRLSPLGVLTASAVLSGLGLFMLGGVSTPAGAFLAATVFGVGKTYFWPTMLGVTSELFPRGGALLMSIMGGAGMLSIAFILPVMGHWYDVQGAAATFRYVAIEPLALIFVFGALFLRFRSKGGYKAIKIK
jgi:MFS family permease